jgi:KDO2-lipid IV(A) lauroyltransferase
MVLLSLFPLKGLRLLGWLLGQLLFYCAKKRRSIVLVNLTLCFPQLSQKERLALAKQHVIAFTQAALDRSWLWHGRPSVLRRRLSFIGSTHVLTNQEPLVIFAPHFVGLDAAGMALSVHLDLPIVSIYSPQKNTMMDTWMQKGRTRFGNARIFSRYAGVKSVVKAIRQGERLYLLPDMDFGIADAVFVPFFGVETATITSVSKFANLGKAQVISVFSALTPKGYNIHIRNHDWKNIPSTDVKADTLYMNQQLEHYIQEIPSQYYWVHKRFKTRPPENPLSFYHHSSADIGESL